MNRDNKPAAINPAPQSSAPQPVVELSEDNSRVKASLPTGESVEVLLHGATVISWKSADGTENLWLSEAAKLDGSKPVRGGVPVVFPNFGPPPKDHATSKLPQHGFARGTRWEFLGKSTSESGSVSKGGDDTIKLDFGLGSSQLAAVDREKWPHDFGLVYSVTLGREGLQTMMNVRNEGQEAWEFQVLLHTYLRVKDVTTTTIAGFLGVTYTDRVLTPIATHTESNTHLPITGEIDRVYHTIPQDTTTVVGQGVPRFDIVRDNVQDTVVWNPWIEKAQGMGDFMPKEGYMNMLCVEVGAVSGWTKLEPGETWEGGQVMKSLL